MLPGIEAVSLTEAQEAQEAQETVFLTVSKLREGRSAGLDVKLQTRVNQYAPLCLSGTSVASAHFI